MANNSTIERIENSQIQDFLEFVNTQYANEKIAVDICDLGYCVRAKQFIKNGEIIYTFTGETISFDETKVRGEMECMSLQFDFNKYLDTASPGKFINHSCEPNSGIKDDFNLTALADIAENEEIRFDYSTTMDEDSYQMDCKCGKENCRSIVTDFKLIPEETQRKYLKLGVVMRFIRNQYKIRE